MYLKDRVVIVTGAAGKFGLVICERVLQQGGKVCMVDIDREKLTNKANLLIRQYSDELVTYFECDVTLKKPFEAAFRHARYVFGAVDVLVNAAAVKGELAWERNINVNLGGVLNCSETACAYFHEASKNGVVVNVGSLAGVKPEQYTNIPTSAAARAGVVAYTRCLANGCATVRTLCVCPSDTPITATLRVVEPLRMTGTPGVLSPYDNTAQSNQSNAFADTFERMIADDNNSGTVVVMDTENNITVA